ncbi:MAG TPA: gamma-glutamyltransferase, partial [Blastocatellia bacterium]|nr:gamma-glutamyltransferase [Blastocatellia bacterium]
MKKTLVIAFLVFILVPLVPSPRAASKEPVRSPHGMVASTSEIASAVGADIMKRGGNAVDAAVAVGLALAVVWPAAGNLGGGGFMMVRLANGKSEVIDYRERAPLAASRDMYLDPSGNVIKDASIVGYKAIGVPGTVAGMAMAEQRYGRLKWADVVEPALKLAGDGFILNHITAGTMMHSSKLLGQFQDSNRIFLRSGDYYKEGDRFLQPELAATLARLKEKGPRDFYDGETARLIVDDVKSHGGLLTAEDFKQYDPTIRQPLIGTYRGYQIITMPPPSSGGAVLLEELNVLEHYDLSKMGHNSSDYLHVLTEVMRRAFADRAAYMGDTDFVKVPVAGMTSKKYAADLVKTIDPVNATPSSEVRAGNATAYESPETTHYTVVDAEGNAVSNTYTLNNGFGSGVTAHGTGILLNDEMDDFTSKPGSPNMFGLLQSEANAIAPRKRPLSAMTPTIVLKDGKLFFAIGSPGGPTIISTVLQVILNVIDFKMTMQQAIDAPRFHHQWMPDYLAWEPFGLNQDTRAAMEKRGYKFTPRPGNMGDAEGVMIEDGSGVRLGASDPRSGGVP